MLIWHLHGHALGHHGLGDQEQGGTLVHDEVVHALCPEELADLKMVMRMKMEKWDGN
jgi:hypothetical protein